MGLVVGSARIDENGKISGGALGDNNGREVSTQPYYLHSKGWYVLRPKTIALANGLASAMSDACANNHIGYDQSNRYGVIKMVRKYGSMKAIKEKTEADCSSLVRGCCIQNGFDPGDFATSGEAAKLEATVRVLHQLLQKPQSHLHRKSHLPLPEHIKQALIVICVTVRENRTYQWLC
ncbi:MAG: hypothetical protein OGM16_15195 [Lachnospiraceae bacterium]|nr:MAG: hypothetical protein OGM16_15195 [Lachnospiraceae bacterium]